MPAEGLPWIDRARYLTYEQITRLVGVLAPLGVRTVRITGGEPLLRNDVARLVRLLRSVPDLDEVAITTNGTNLERYAKELVEAGVDRFNVSLDSLEPTRFADLTRRHALDRVLRGLDALKDAAAGPVKINAVAVKGLTEDEIFAFAEFAAVTGIEVRFIEFMPLDADQAWTKDEFVSGQELLETLMNRYDLMEEPRKAASTARTFMIRNTLGKIGLVEPISRPFCADCNRIRLTADGYLRTCLFSQWETDLGEPLRSGASDRDIEELVRSAVWRKELKHRITELGFVQPKRSMSSIGG